LTAEAYFIKWNLASKVLPDILYDNDFYINKFTDYLKPRERLGKCSKNVFALAKDGKGIFNIGELFTGYSRLIINLATPPRRTVVLIPDKNHLKYIKLKSGYTFIVYDNKDKSYYRVFEEGGNIKTKPYP